jgi:hypothetical protein
VRFGGGNGAIFRNQKFRKMWRNRIFETKTHRWRCSYMQIRSDDEKILLSAAADYARRLDRSRSKRRFGLRLFTTEFSPAQSAQ